MKYVLGSTAIAWLGVLLGGLAGWAPAPGVNAQAGRPARPPTTAALSAQFDHTVRPFLEKYCAECHHGADAEADFDLSALTSMAAAVDEPRLGLMLEMLEAGEMPADDAKAQPTPREREAAITWLRRLRDAEIARNAGDPGLVLARRLNNSEYNYTIRDLTGVDLQPTREFPVDPSNTAGFDNSGESLVMSPALLKKYLAAARDVANHLYLEPEGFAFAPHAMLSEPDRDKFNVHRIIEFYRRHETDTLAYFAAAWRFKHRRALGHPRATLASTAAAAGLSAKYLATLWDVFEGPPEAVGPIAAVQARWRALPAPGPRGEDTAVAGREALRTYVVRLRGKIEPRFPNIASGGVNSAQQPFLIWKNVQYATHRMTYDPRQLQIDGVVAMPPYVGPEPGATGAFGPGATTFVVNAPGDADLFVPAADRARYEAGFARFARVFPDKFLMEERGRHYFNPGTDRGRYLDAGFHSLMGYFRDDRPLYELILEPREQAELDALWVAMDFGGAATARMYEQFIENQTSQGGGRSRVVMPPNPTGALAISAERIAAVEAAFLAAAATPGDVAVDPRAADAIRGYFRFIDGRLRQTEALHRAAEPIHVTALVTFAAKAFRRPLAPAEAQAIRAAYAAARRDGLDHEAAIREGVAGILVAPDFLYRLDRLESSSKIAPLSDYALASRLSYFLWSSLPDDELLARARAGDLREPGVIAAQARRMLRDPRARALAVEFGGNWLDIRRFAELNTVDRERFPQFTSELRQAMFEEPVRLLLDVMQTNRPVLDLLYAKDTFVNPVLAAHYGMPVPAGPPQAWTRVADADRYGRGGLLPMAAFLTKHAPGLRTSPVKRGNWVVRNVLGEHISPPPPTVPQLPTDEAKLDLPLRETMARHRADPQCAACHAKFDAMGLVFEGYGPIGERREQDLAGRAVDVSATFPGGAEGRGVEGLRAYIRAHRQRDFVDNVGTKLLAYALGRSFLLTDQPLVDEMSRGAAASGYRFEAFVERIVTSRQFLTTRGSVTRGPHHEPVPVASH